MRFYYFTKTLHTRHWLDRCEGFYVYDLGNEMDMRRRKCRLLVDGALLYGGVDESGTLEPNQVFIQYRMRSGTLKQYYGDLFVTR